MPIDQETLAGSTVRVVTKEAVPFVEISYDDGEPVYGGLCFDMLRELQRRIGFNVSIEHLDAAAATNDLIVKVENNEADIALSWITISEARAGALPLSLASFCACFAHCSKRRTRRFQPAVLLAELAIHCAQGRLQDQFLVVSGTVFARSLACDCAVAAWVSLEECWAGFWVDVKGFL